MDQVSKLTMRQISLIYYRERDKNGIPKPIKSGRQKEKSKEQLKQEFFDLGRAFGYTESQMQAQWELNNGRA